MGLGKTMEVIALIATRGRKDDGKISTIQNNRAVSKATFSKFSLLFFLFFHPVFFFFENNSRGVIRATDTQIEAPTQRAAHLRRRHFFFF